MFGSQVLEVSIGVVFVYLLLSIICTAANELIASVFALRASNLSTAISNLLADRRVKGLAELFYEHPLIKGLQRGTRKPSYIPARTFALAFLDGIVPTKGDATTLVAEMRAAVSALGDDSDIKRVLLILLQESGEDPVKLRKNVEQWFNDAMARAGGWYKRKTQIITIGLAMAVVGATNADTVELVGRLSRDPALAAALVAQAQAFLNEHPGGVGAPAGESGAASLQDGGSVAEAGGGVPASASTGATDATTGKANVTSAKDALTEAVGNLQGIGVPLGWRAMPKGEEWVNKVFGLLLTVLAVSLGAPFWFDVLGNVTKIRSTGAALAHGAEEGKKARPGAT